MKVPAADLLSRSGLSPAQQSLDPYEKFRSFEGFREVVVRTGLETLNLVVEFCPGGEHKDRRQHAVLAEIPRHVKTASGRKHHVEHDEIEGLMLCKFLRFRTIA